MMVQDMKTIKEYIEAKSANLNEAYMETSLGTGWKSMQDYDGKAKGGILLVFNCGKSFDEEQVMMVAGVKDDKQAKEIFTKNGFNDIKGLLGVSKHDIGRPTSWGYYTVAQCKRDVRFKNIPVWEPC